MLFEKKWAEIKPYFERKNGKQMTDEEEWAHQLEHEGFNRIKQVDMPLFEPFLDQGVIMRETFDPKDLIANNRFWDKERHLA